ncbi:MAG: hypothetical protein SGJ09_11010 [Phycisphaerae bacterium]|nr:hypothetical protein [Phycisphaerae bacterium]
MKKVLDWVKSNVLIAVLGVVAFAAIGLGWFFSGSLNESVQRTAKERAGKMAELTGLEKSSVTLNIPGREVAPKTVVINEQLLAQYKTASDQLRGDADKIRSLALALNQSDHKLVLDGVFPKPPDDKKATVPFRLQEAIQAAYTKLFAEVNAGGPPAPEQVAEDLARRESQYIQSTLRKANREALDEREKKDLSEELSRNRLAIYGEQAQKITLYATTAGVQIPPVPGGRALPTMAEMFDWQWRYWIVRDIVHAIADASAAANGGTQGSVLKSPVKRLIRIRVDPADFATSAGASGGAEGPGAGFGGGFGATTPPADGSMGTSPDGVVAAAPALPNQPLGEPQIDMATEAPRDFAKSLTGRQKNNAFDVRRATVEAVIATSELPQFFDALAKRNFITVTNVRVQQIDAFSEASQGFVYGREPVSAVTIELESAWLREWVAPLMPADVRTALGIQNKGASDGAAAKTPDAG